VIGALYRAKIGNALTTVEILEPYQHGWIAKNQSTGRDVRIKSARKLRSRVNVAVTLPSEVVMPNTSAERLSSTMHHENEPAREQAEMLDFDQHAVDQAPLTTYTVTAVITVEAYSAQNAIDIANTIPFSEPECVSATAERSAPQVERFFPSQDIASHGKLYVDKTPRQDIAHHWYRLTPDQYEALTNAIPRDWLGDYFVKFAACHRLDADYGTERFYWFLCETDSPAHGFMSTQFPMLGKVVSE
jgi:hypothetical protein